MRLILTTFLLIFVNFAAFAQESGKAEFDFALFQSTAQRAVAAVEKADASNSALGTLRSQLSGFRSAALTEKARYTDRIATLDEQLAVLGTAPAEGTAEAPELAARRADLTDQLAQARAPSIAAEEAYQRSNGLIREIDLIMRSRSTNELLTLGPSPLNPGHWIGVAVSVKSYIKLIYNEIVGNWDNPARRVTRVSNLPIVAVMFALGLVLMLRSRAWLQRVLLFGQRDTSDRVSAFSAFLASLAKLVLPIIGLTLLLWAIVLLDLLELRGDFLLRKVGYGGAVLYFASWLSRNLLHPIGSQPAFVQLEPKARATTHRAIMGLGIVFALQALVEAMNNSKDLPEQAIAVLMFPLVLLGAYSLFRLGRQISTLAKSSGGSPEANPFLTKVGLLIGNFCVAVSAFGPVLSAIGYGDAGSGLIFSAALSLILVFSFYIFFQLLGMLSGMIAKPGDQPGRPEDQVRHGAMFRMALGFAFIFLALPLMALIWGARVSDLQEVWLYLQDGVSVGNARLSISDFLTFILIFSLGYTITRLLQSALKSNVLPNTRLDAGGQNAIVTGTGYLGIFLAALAAISATGLDLSNLAIVAGALSVGIGFGLQAIVSNFVSGIILLIERPIKEGDWIEVGGYSGYVRKISVRSTTVDTFDRATVIIPNADLIAGTVTNWTHGSMMGRVKVPVGVSYDSDPRQVQTLLLDIAKDHPMVLRDPGPSVVFLGFGADSLNFEIRAILRDVNWVLSAKSDMNFEIMKRFSEVGIVIPFAQRDINLKNIKELGDALKGTPNGST